MDLHCLAHTYTALVASNSLVQIQKYIYTYEAFKWAKGHASEHLRAYQSRGSYVKSASILLHGPLT